MLRHTSNDFRKNFFLEFTYQLIRARSPEFFLKEQINEKIAEKKQEREQENLRIKTIRDLRKQAPEIFKKSYLGKTKIKEIPSQPQRVLKIPEPRLPAHLQYLRPTPQKISFDLGKLNPLVRDSLVQSIECIGPDTNLIVHIPQEKRTSIKLSKEEIEEIISIFEKESKIPVDEGFYRVVTGNLIFSAIISETTGSKFVIKKMSMPNIRRRTRVKEFRPILRR